MPWWSLLNIARNEGVKLNTNKLNLWQKEVHIPFIGHVATNQGLRVEPAKIRAISEMTAPTDKAGV